MVGNHIAQRTGIVEVRPTTLDANCLRIRNLDMIDIPPIPDSLEDRIIKAKDHCVLHVLFPQIMIDRKDLVLLQHTLDIAVKRLSRFQILTKGLLNDNTSPASFFLSR